MILLMIMVADDDDDVNENDDDSDKVKDKIYSSINVGDVKKVIVFVVAAVAATDDDDTNSRCTWLFQGYMAYMLEKEVSDEMKEKCKIVFGNVHQIFEWHKETFSEELLRCEEDPDRLAGLFLRLVSNRPFLQQDVLP